MGAHLAWLATETQVHLGNRDLHIVESLSEIPHVCTAVAFVCGAWHWAARAPRSACNDGPGKP